MQCPITYKKEPDYVKNEFAENVMTFIKKLIENHPDKKGKNVVFGKNDG